MKISKTIGRKFTQNTKKIHSKITQKPLRFFYISLCALVGLIIMGNFLRKPSADVENARKVAQTVDVYSIGGSPRITVTGEVEKSGVIQIVALTSGVVQKINYYEGAQIAKGAVLLRLASNYHGGNAFSAQRQIATVQYQQVRDTYDAQKELIAKQKESASKLDAQSAELRDITNASISETKDLIALNSSIISKLDSNLAVLNADPVGNADLILSTKQIKSQFVAGQNQANSALRQSEYQASDDTEPAELSRLQRDIAIKQLDIQSTMLDVQKEVSRLQVSLAYIAEGMTTPAAPFSGIVQRVFVKVGEVVNPGTPLAIVSQTYDDPITVVAYVDRDIAENISLSEPATITVHDEEISLMPHFVSSDAVANGLYAVYFALPDSFISKVTDKDHAQVQLSLSDKDTVSKKPYIPLDTVHQTATSAYVFIADNGKAKAKKVELGSVFGSLVEVHGLSEEELIIVDRDITEGEAISISQK